MGYAKVQKAKKEEKVDVIGPNPGNKSRGTASCIPPISTPGINRRISYVI